MGIRSPSNVLSMEDMVGNDDVIFAATGITPGDFLGGVKVLPEEQIETHSIVMRAKSRTVRYLRSVHRLDCKPGMQTLRPDWTPMPGRTAAG
jgi:fructose-1,6-bisphosphatase II